MIECYTYGDKFKIGENTYMLTHIGNGLSSLVGIEEGNIFDHGIKLQPINCVYNDYFPMVQISRLTNKKLLPVNTPLFFMVEPLDL